MEEKCLWGIIDELRDDVNAHIDAITDMDAVNDTYQGEIFKLEAENKRIRNTLRGNTSMFDELKAEINELKEDRRENSKTINELMIDKNRLMNQVSSNRGSNSNTIQREIAEYMSHNDTCKGARLFLLPIDEFKDGEWKHGCLFWDDGME